MVARCWLTVMRRRKRKSECSAARLLSILTQPMSESSALTLVRRACQHSVDEFRLFLLLLFSAGGEYATI